VHGGSRLDGRRGCLDRKSKNERPRAAFAPRTVGRRSVLLPLSPPCRSTLATTPRRLPRDGQASCGRRAAPRIRGARVPRLPDMRRAGARLRASPMHRDGRSGSVTVIQRFGSGLNLNVHCHTLLFDGVFFIDRASGALEFRPLPPPTDEEVAVVLARIATRVQRLLKRRGLDHGKADSSPADPVVEESPALAGITSASVQGSIALGPRAGARVWRLGEDPDAPWVLSTAPRHAHLAGFDLHANVAVPAVDRTRLEQLCRYLLRPRWRRTDCDSSRTVASCSRSRPPGRTARAISSSSRSRCSRCSRRRAGLPALRRAFAPARHGRRPGRDSGDPGRRRGFG